MDGLNKISIEQIPLPHEDFPTRPSSCTPYFPKAALKFLGTTEGHTVQITRKADCFLGSRNAPTLFHRPSTFPWKNSSKK